MKLLMISVLPPATIPEADHAYHIARHLAEAHIDVDVVAQVGGAVPKQAHLTAHPVMQEWSWPELPKLVNCIRRCRPDVVLLVYLGILYNHNTMVTYLPSILKALMPRTLFITQMENANGAMSKGIVARTLNKILRKLMGRYAHFAFGTLLRDSHRVILLSKFHSKRLEEAYPDMQQKTVLIPPAPLLNMSPAEDVVRQEQRSALGVAPGKTLLVYFGYLYASKGISTLLSAFEIVCRRNKNVHLLIAGGTLASSSGFPISFVEELHSRATEPELHGRVTFTGAYDWDSDQGSRYLRAADIAVLPFDDGIRMNNSSVAAVAVHGLPIISTMGEELETPFVNEQNVYLCPPKDPVQLSAAIEAVIEQTNLRETLAEGASELAHDWFSWEAVVQRLLSCCELQQTESAALTYQDVSSSA